MLASSKACIGQVCKECEGAQKVRMKENTQHRLISMGHAAGKFVMHGPHDLRAIVLRGTFGWFSPSGPLYETVRPRARGRCLTLVWRDTRIMFLFIYLFNSSQRDSAPDIYMYMWESTNSAIRINYDQM